MKSLGAQDPDIVINTSLLLQHFPSRRIRRKKNFEFFVTEQSFAKIATRG